MSRADVAIVGAGIAGAALAARLAGQGLSIVLLEAAARPGAPPLAGGIGDVDPRVSALNAASRALLARCGAWDALPVQACCPYRAMRVWEQDGTGAIGFEAADCGLPELGHIVENRWVLACLLEALGRAGGVELHWGERLAALEPAGPGGTHARLAFASGREVLARLVVGADGAQSAVRALCGIAAATEETGQRAIVATVRTDGTHAHTAWQCFLPSGPLALLPLAALPDASACSIVWSADEAVADGLLALGDAAFARRLTQASEGAAGTVLEVTPRLAFPLRQLHAASYSAGGVALVGDAAHVVHPLAGQGINLGLADVGVLAGEIERAIAGGRSPGDAAVTGRYARRRRGENAAMLAAMRGFRELFGATHPALRLARNIGLVAADRSAALKRALMRRAMGL